jgi:transcriptional regulator with XRE-family HTH domain
MMTLDEIRSSLRDRKVRAVADAIGVHNQTVYSILNDRTHNPKYDTLRKLSDYLSE